MYLHTHLQQNIRHTNDSIVTILSDSQQGFGQLDLLTTYGS
jgi:hypothetical protein